ncbi:MAG: Glu-tRNA(Gln) amidotransferase subunit GatD [Candidatus Thorarchaeota archaeon]|nr:Glu-tRNA(Gln) amidotransferase subunit GatD [Candidatus Thorarchaeota archaeon]
MVLEKLSSLDIKVGDRVKIHHDGRDFQGILMPRSQVGADPYHLVLKLDNGYNTGIKIDAATIITKSKSSRVKKPKTTETVQKLNPLLPTVLVMSTGGTIASRVDYRTGAVNPALTAQDLYDSVPELQDYANINAQVAMSILSENIRTSDWTKIAKIIAKEIKEGETDGVVIAHGTDTMGYTAAALSFALQNLPVPIAIVGSQRSSDRPSSDASLNLTGATNLVGRTDVAEVMVVMHAQTDDSYLYAHRGSRVRKLHTSRRDAFQSVNSYPLFRIEENEIEELSTPLLRRDPKRVLTVKPQFEELVALVKTYPGIDGKIVDYFVDNGYRGIILEGTGLGHVPDTLQSSLKKAVDSGLVVAMTSQCIHGRVNMDVYRSGVELLEIGVVPCQDMIAETALVKLMWLLANTKTSEQAGTLMYTPLAGEIEVRSEYPQYDADVEMY